MPQLLFAPFSLVQPQRSKFSYCQLCQKQFGLTTREHLCKRCFRFVCDTCSPHKQKVYKANLQHRLHRLCNCCHTQSQILKKYVEMNKIQWGKDSQMCRIWLKQIGQRNQNKQVVKKRKRQQFTSTVQKFWESLNYSFRQLIGRAIEQNKSIQQQYSNEKKDKNRQIQIHKKVLQQTLQIFALLISKLPKINLAQTQSMFYIFIFFMVHASPQNTLILCTELFQIISSYTYSQQSFAILLQKLNFSRADSYKIEDYLQAHSNQIFKAVTINYFSIEISIEIIGLLFNKKDIRQLQKAAIYVISKKKDYVVKNSNKPQLIQIQLLRNNQGLGEGYKTYSKHIQIQQEQQKPSTSNVNAKQLKAKVKVKQPIRSYDSLVKQNQQLKIKNKNQQQQIERLKVENKRLATNQKKIKNKEKSINQMNSIDDSDKSYQSYWQQQNGINNQSSQNSFKNDQSKSKQKHAKKLVKKYRLKQLQKKQKRMTTMSQKLVKQIQQLNKSNQKQFPPQQKFQQLITDKNQQISNLKKQIQTIKNTNKQTEQTLKKQKQKNILKQKQQDQQNVKIKKQLQKMKQMNKQLLLKMKQLSNMLMDKQQEQMKQYQQANLEQLAEIYQEQVKDDNRDCAIF